MPASRTELVRELKWRTWQERPEAFFADVWRIKHPEHGAMLFEPREAQLTGLRAFEDNKMVITLKARQIGWTTLVSAFAFWQAYFHGKTVIFLSRRERDAQDIVEKVKFGRDRLPRWVADRGPRLLKDSLQEMTFANGGGIESHPSQSNPARGRTASLVVLDEWAFLENPEDAWASVEPTFDIGGRFIGLSTANGAGNFFHQMWQLAESGHSDLHPLFLPFDAVPGRDDDWYETKKRNLLDWQLHQEYPRTPEEAFIKSGRSVFDVDALRAMPTTDPLVGYLHEVYPRTYDFREGGDELSVWEPPWLEHDYVIGADVAEGLEHGDASCAHVIDLDTDEVVAIWHGRIDPDQFGLKLADLGYRYNTALVGCEANNHGLTSLVALRNTRYPRIYYRHVYDESARRATSKLGWYTDRRTKPLMIDELAMALRNELKLADKRTIGELLTYVRDEKGRMGGSPFDDLVMSLAIANQMRKHAHSREYKRDRDGYMTMDWWVQQAIENQQKTPLIGAHSVRGR